MNYREIKDKKLICTKCNTIFKCSRHRLYKYTQKLKSNKVFQCLCNQCKPKPKQDHLCLTCKTVTKNSKFCSRSCSQTFNNKLKPKRKPIERTCSCGKKFIPKSKSSRILCSLCQEHRSNSTKYKTMTLFEYNNKISVKGKHPSWKNSHIRLFNRQWNKSLTKLPCSKCGYDKHVELCHIKAVTSFPNTATLGEINSSDNNKVLCPNCHWEFDYNLLN